MPSIETSSSTKTFLERFLYLFSLDRQTAPVLVVALFSTAVITVIIVVTNGNIFAAFGPLLVFTLVLLTYYRIDYSLFLLIGCVLLFEQFGIPGFNPVTHSIDYFKNIKEISYLPTINAGVMNIIEIHLLLILFFWIFNLCISKRFSLTRIPVWGALGMFFMWMIFAFGYGLKTGAEFLTAIWEVRALFYFMLMYVAIPQVVQTKRQLNILLWVIIVAISVKAFQGVGRFVSLGFSFQGWAALTSHEDPVFMTSLFILLAGLLLYKVKNMQRNVLIFLFVPLLAGFFVAQRRAAIAGLLMALTALFMLLPGIKKRTFLKITVPITIVLLIYGTVFWNSQSKWARPVQMFKSGIVKSEKALSKEDYYSNLYRHFENYNLAYTFRIHPIVGTGFGKKYDQPLQLANISFPLKDYIPHNQIFWIIVKSGGIGFFFFWLFFNAFAFQGSYVLKNLNSPYLKAVCIMIIVAIINQMTVSFFDLQLTYYRNMIYLGTLMGLLPVLQEIDFKQITKSEGE